MHDHEQANTDAGGFASPRVPRPEKVSRAGTVMVTLGIIGVAASTLICLFAWMLAFSLSSPNNGGTGVHWAFYTLFFPIAALITSPWVMQIICGVSVLRGRRWVRTPALIVTSLALAGSLAPFLSRPAMPWSAVVALYAAATLWSLTMLMSRDVSTWCRRA